MKKKPKKKQKDPNSLSAQRGRVRAQLLDSVTVVGIQQQKPWTYVDFLSGYYTKDGTPRYLRLWGVSKVSWPDRWNDEEGIQRAVERGVAWALKLIVPPSHANLADAVARLEMLIVEKDDTSQAEERATQSLYAGQR